MKRLTLVRHAKSSWKDPIAADFDRPLNSRGKRDAPEMGKRMKRAGLSPDLIVSSPARRARRTARIVARELGIPKDDIVFEGEIYEAGVADLLNILSLLPEDIGHAMIVGHNPGFTDFLNYLTAEGIANLPTCGIAVVDLDADSWKSVGRKTGRLVFFDFPKSVKDSG